MSFQLFDLLPAVYRIRDAAIAQALALLTPAEQTTLAALQLLQSSSALLSADQQAQLDELLAKASRGPLQSLLMLVQEQVAAVEYDIEQLYDDQFIETCAPWVIPYIGDLIGYRSVKGISSAIDNPRSEVAETISLRRRKGTVLVMEQLARDATGWGAHAVEMFQVLAETQYMKHVRPANFYAPDLSYWHPGLYIDTGFDRTAHKFDVRRIEPQRGRYNIQNIGIFLWSLGAYSITEGTPTRAATNSTHAGQFCYRFSSLGADMPLFRKAAPQGEQITAMAQPVNVPDRLKRRVLCDDIQKGVGALYYGEGASLAITLDGNLLNPYQIKVADLSGDDGAWANLPASGGLYSAVIDPELGRIAFADDPTADSKPPKVSYYYGFNADMGGGEYSREDTFLVDDPAWIVSVDSNSGDLNVAITNALSHQNIHAQVAVEIDGSETLAWKPQPIELAAGTTLELRAADGTRPTLLLADELTVTGGESSTLVINGLLVAADSGMKPASPSPVALVHVPELRSDGSANLLATLSLIHCTLVPGWSLDEHGNPNEPGAPTIVAEAAGTAVSICRSIVGPILCSEFTTVNATDSIIDATDLVAGTPPTRVSCPTNVAYAALDGMSGGGPLTLNGCSVAGKVHSVLLSLVSNSIIWGALAAADVKPWVSALVADRKQQGCVRFSFIPYQAVIPRHFKNVSHGLALPQPYFISIRYGHPAYMKLLASTDDSIRRGADAGSINSSESCNPTTTPGSSAQAGVQYSGVSEMGAFSFVLAPQRESDLLIRLQEYVPVNLEFGLIYQN
ncbi:MAG: hypothetical protein WCC87_05925 [Candidatus Korobacteraceae bacterium]